MSENEIGYRGSKSEFNYSVKEQRVDGSWLLNKLAIPNRSLRCTLVDYKNSYLIKILSKQLKLSKLNFSTNSANQTKLDPYFVTGLIDAEGSFITTIYKQKNLKIGWRVLSYFEITLNESDKSVLSQLQEFFGGIGTIRSDKFSNSLKYSVGDIKVLNEIIIPHFKQYPLLSKKAADFILFSQIIELMNNKAHLTINGLQKILNIKATMNLGLSDLIKSEFNAINPVKRPVINTTSIHNLNWISGFTTGDGNFDAGIRSSGLHSSKVYLRFRISQHIKDIKLLELIIKTLSVGRIEKSNNDSVVNLVVGRSSDLNKIIIPFFNKYSLRGNKQLDFLDWCKIANLINIGSHLTKEGLEEIRKIRLGMNKGRWK
jgi:LAGLIDADG endonuclease